MSGEFMGLLSAVSFAAGNIIARMTLRGHGSPFGATVMFAAATAIIWLVVFATGAALPSHSALQLFVLRGVLDPGLAALFIFVAFRRIGASFTIPIIAASTLVATALSVVFLKETLTYFIIAGTILIVAGVSFLSLSHNGFHANRKYIVMAIIGSILIGVANVVSKVALNVSGTVESGVAIAFTTGLLLHAVFLTASGKWRELPVAWKFSRYFMLAGVFIGAAFLTSFAALSVGQVSVIYPLISTQPLFALFLFYALLRKDEIITRNVVLGTIMVVLGAALLFG